MSRRLVPNQCGCNCTNDAFYSPEGDKSPCCEWCLDGAPCEYIMLWPCHQKWRCTPSGTGSAPTCIGDGGIYSQPYALEIYPCMTLKQDCSVRGCRYSVRRSCRTFSGETTNDEVVGCKSECPPYVWYEYEATPWAIFPVNKPTFGCFDRGYSGTGATYTDHPCAFGDVPDSYIDTYPNEVDATYFEWVLDINGLNQAYLYGLPYPGCGLNPSDTVLFFCGSFSCTTRNTFTGLNYGEIGTKYPGMPFKVCLEPGYTNFTTPCSPPSKACSCCDRGDDTATFGLVSDSCGHWCSFPEVGPIVHYHTIVFNTTRNATLPTCVSNPGGACGYFWGISAANCCHDGRGVTYGMLVWCDGTDWWVSIYCCGQAGSCACVLICTVKATRTKCCPNFEIEFSCEGHSFITCCCIPAGTGSTTPPPPVTTYCCDIPNTIYASLSSTDCPGLSGTAALTFYSSSGPSSDPNTSYCFRGSGSFGSCGTLYIEVCFTCSPRTAYVNVFKTAFPSSGACLASGSSLGWACPFVGKTFPPRAWDSAACSCCAGMGRVTVTITA